MIWIIKFLLIDSMQGSSKIMPEHGAGTRRCVPASVFELQKEHYAMQTLTERCYLQIRTYSQACAVELLAVAESSRLLVEQLANLQVGPGCALGR